MGTITVKNLSTLSDSSAVARVARFLQKDTHSATHDCNGVQIVYIICSGNCFTVVDAEVTK